MNQRTRGAALKEEHKRHGYVIRAGKRKWKVTQWFEIIRRRARKRGLECTISANDLEIPTHCPLLGIPLFFSDGKQTPNTPSIDRIDNTRGYTPDNIQVISWEANFVKLNQTLEHVRKRITFFQQLEQIMVQHTKGAP